jgi:hypothetical protein
MCATLRPPMAQTTFIRARVTPALAEQFQLAAQLDGRTASSALRHLARTYIESVAEPRNDNAARERGGAACDSATDNATQTGRGARAA